MSSSINKQSLIQSSQGSHQISHGSYQSTAYQAHFQEPVTGTSTAGGHSQGNTTGKQIREKVHGHSRTQSSHPGTTNPPVGHTHIRNNSDYRVSGSKLQGEDFNLNEDSIKIERSIYTGTGNVGIGSSGLGTGPKLIQRRIPATGLIGGGTGQGSGLGGSNSVNTSNYGKNSSNKRFQYR